MYRRVSRYVGDSWYIPREEAQAARWMFVAFLLVVLRVEENISQNQRRVKGNEMKDFELVSVCV